MNIKDEIHFVSNGDATITLSYGEIEVEKDANRDMFYLDSIARSLARTLKIQNLYIYNFMNTYHFYTQLCLIDPKLPKYGNVYLLADKKAKTFKPGKTYNFDVRYKEEKKKQLVICIPVYNQTQVETKILKHFRSKYELVKGTRETFKYTGKFEDIVEEFESLIPKSQRAKIDTKITQHISNKFTCLDKQGLWGSINVFDILANNYIERPSDRKRYIFFLENISKFIDNDSYVYRVYNKELKTDCTFWQYHKYTFIQNESDGMVNGSRLWNSIKKAENIKIRTSLKAFLESKQIQEKKEAFAKLFPGQVMYTDNYKNIEQPQFNGIEVHPAIVHYIVDKLDAEYGFMVAIMAFKKFVKPIPTSNHNMTVKKLNDSFDVERYRKSMNTFGNLNDLIRFMNMI